MGLMFFPRGGSARWRATWPARCPTRAGTCTIACGSLGAAGRAVPRRDLLRRARRAPARLHAVGRGAPTRWRADPPFQPSYEDRAGAPDRVFARVDDEAYERLVATWGATSSAAGAAEADVLHLHHLTPINEAAERAFPDVPRVGHLHGTELLMLREIDEGPPAGWDHAEAWAERMRRWARRLRAAVRALAGRGAAGARACSAWSPSAWSGRPTASTRRASTAARPTATSALGALAPLAGGGAARLGRVRRAGQRGLRRGGPGAVRAGGPGAALRRALHRGEAHPAADPRARARARALRAARAAGAARRLPGRVGGRAPARGGARRPATTTSSSPAGAATTTCPTA